MKKIEAIIRLSRFDRVRDELAKIGVTFFSLKEVKGFGLQKGEKLMYRGSVYDSDYIARLQIDILCETERAQEIVDCIAGAAKTGEVGDGKITILPVDSVTRVRTGEINESAL